MINLILSALMLWKVGNPAPGISGTALTLLLIAARIAITLTWRLRMRIRKTRGHHVQLEARR